MNFKLNIEIIAQKTVEKKMSRSRVYNRNKWREQKGKFEKMQRMLTKMR